MSKEVKVTFQPSGRSVFVLPGTVVLEAAAQAGFIISSPCGGAGKCGKCLVRVVSRKPLAPPSSGEEKVIGPEMCRDGYRLACQWKIPWEVSVEIPDSSLFQSSQKILSDHKSEALRIDRVSGTPGHDEAGPMAGAAVDIGTTTMVATLIDMHTGVELAVSSRVNPQTAHGDDVISRVKKCREEADGLKVLNELVVGAVNRLFADAAKQAGIKTSDIRMAVFAGNTAMQEIFCNIDPSGLGEIPFAPAFLEAQKRRAGDLGLAMDSDAPVYVFPQIGGFVGGDTVAGIVAVHLDELQKPTLLVDVGTNGEIVLAHQGHLLAASVAAGPAFEGARIINGMRGMTGAIEKVLFDGRDFVFNVIGNVKPAGLCGSGLIDVVAEMLNAGVVDSTGRILDPDELPASLPEKLRQRVLAGENHNDFLLVGGAASAAGNDLCLYQRDIRELQLASAAIHAGINILLKLRGLKPCDLDAVLLAGAFGNFIRRNHALRIGMLPPVPCDRIRFVGNTSSLGAKKILLSAEEEAYAARVAAKTQHIDLSSAPDFQDEFGEAMLFPEG
jgi:uncharacterized 2Fe-2S/4Fe-4S cluster protein (DUF4445 family)